jgi:hypothetical protein
MLLNSEIFQALFADEDLYFIKDKSFDNIEDENIIEIEPKAEKPIVIELPAIEVEKVVDKEEAINNEPIISNNISAFPLLIVTESITEAQKVFIEKVLNSVGLGLDSIELYSKDLYPNTNFRAFSENKSYKKIISFGVPFARLNIAIMMLPYENTRVENIVFLLAEKLIVVENDVAHKRKLWACLQEMFKI